MSWRSPRICSINAHAPTRGMAHSQGDGMVTRGRHAHEGTACSLGDGTLMRGQHTHEGTARSRGDSTLTRGQCAHKGMAHSRGDGMLMRGWCAHKGTGHSMLTRGWPMNRWHGMDQREDVQIGTVELLTWPCEMAQFPNVNLNFCSMLPCRPVHPLRHSVCQCTFN